MDLPLVSSWTTANFHRNDIVSCKSTLANGLNNPYTNNSIQSPTICRSSESRQQQTNTIDKLKTKPVKAFYNEENITFLSNAQTSSKLPELTKNDRKTEEQMSTLISTAQNTIFQWHTPHTTNQLCDTSSVESMSLIIFGRWQDANKLLFIPSWL